jgi:AAA domain
VILTGPPGAGKTTVAAALAARSEQRAVHLHSDDFYASIRSGYIAPYLAAAHEQNQVVAGVLAGAAFGYAAGGYRVVLNGIIGPWFLDGFRDRADVPVHYVVLRPELAVTLCRAQGRTSRTLRDSGPVRGLHQAFSELGDLEPHVLDMTRLSAEQTVARVETAVASGRFRLPPPPRAAPPAAQDAGP